MPSCLLIYLSCLIFAGIVPVADVRSVGQNTGKRRANDRPKRQSLLARRRPDCRAPGAAVVARKSLTGGVRICRQDEPKPQEEGALMALAKTDGRPDFDFALGRRRVRNRKIADIPGAL